MTNYLKKMLIYNISSFINCFRFDRKNRYRYLGITHNIFVTSTENHELLERFIKSTAKHARPAWCPWFVLNLLHLFGNKNSIYFVRNKKLHNLHQKLTKGILITDIKIKFDTLRVYYEGLPLELEYFLRNICLKIDKSLKLY